MVERAGKGASWNADENEHRGVRAALGSRRLTAGMFAVYLAVLVWVILFKMTFGSVIGTIRSVNLIPFAGALVVNGVPNYGEVLQNAVAFAPFGLFLGMLMPRSPFWAKLLPGLSASVAFEVLQFVLAAGATDITDVMANTLGTAVGLGLHALAVRVAGTEERAMRLCNAVALAGTACVCGLLALVLLANA